MVTKKVKEGKQYFVCDECGLIYLNNEIAEKCEKWCKETHSCNPEIIKNAVKIE